MRASGCTSERRSRTFEGQVDGFVVRLEHHGDAEHHRGCTDDGGADEHGLGGGLEGVAGAVALLELVLGALEVGLEPEVALDLGGDAGLLLDLGELVNGLGVIGHGSE